jgi:hypothetical protein
VSYPVGLVNLDPAALAAGAGGDPWKLGDELQAGDAAAIDGLADAFHQSGNHVKEADDDFNAAKQRFQEAYLRNGSEHPINESAQVLQVTAALAGHQENLSRIAADLEEVAASLAIAQRNSDAEIAATNAALHEIDNAISVAQAAGENTALHHAAAVAAVRSALGNMQEIRGGYTGQLHAAEASMMALGYTPDALDSVDGVPGDAASDAAREYEQSGQRAADQALVDQATAAGRDSYLPSMAGRPGHMTGEEAGAASRLRDYRTITAPPLADADRRNPEELRADAQGRRFAGEPLDDFNVVYSTGPVAKDPVLGGDARTRAQARIDLQQDLENGNLSWHRQPLTPDAATQLIDDMEANDRVNAVTRLKGQLAEAGMTPQGAAQAAEGMSHGVIPKELVDRASLANKVIAGGEHAFNRAGDVLPTGKHWTPEVNTYSPQDVEALNRIGSRLGAVGNVIDAGVSLYEWQHGAPLGEVTAKAGGGMAGAWVLGAAGAEIGAAAGPPGVFLGALIGGGIGAWGGEELGEKAYKWLTG